MRLLEGPRSGGLGRGVSLGDRATLHVEGRDVVHAFVDGTRIGGVVIDRHTRPMGPDTRCLWRAAVAVRRQGVGTRLYDAAEGLLKAEGLRLVPSPANTLTPAGWEFWRRRSPELLEGNPLKYVPQYVGVRVGYKGSLWRVKAVHRGATLFLGQREDGATDLLPGHVVHAVAGPPDEEAARLYLYAHAPHRQPSAVGEACGPAPR